MLVVPQLCQAEVAFKNLSKTIIQFVEAIFTLFGQIQPHKPMNLISATIVSSFESQRIWLIYHDLVLLLMNWFFTVAEYLAAIWLWSTVYTGWNWMFVIADYTVFSGETIKLMKCSTLSRPSLESMVLRWI